MGKKVRESRLKKSREGEHLRDYFYMKYERDYMTWSLEVTESWILRSSPPHQAAESLESPACKAHLALLSRGDEKRAMMQEKPLGFSAIFTFFSSRSLRTSQEGTLLLLINTNIYQAHGYAAKHHLPERGKLAGCTQIQRVMKQFRVQPANELLSWQSAPSRLQISCLGGTPRSNLQRKQH